MAADSPAVGQVPSRSCTDRFDALSNHRRLRVVRAVSTRGKLSVSRLAALVGASERSTPVENLSTEFVDRIRLSLVHAHLPKLEDIDVVVYDPEQLKVDVGSRFDRIDSILDAAVGETLDG